MEVSKSGALNLWSILKWLILEISNMENPTGYNAGWTNDHGNSEGS